jgi:hypothetical protein
MTRFLSEALSAREPYFRHGLRHLEALNGNPSTDIIFSSEVVNSTRLKFAELGLDPSDTRPEELYHALIVQAEKDDKLLTRNLRTLAATKISAEADPIAGLVEALKGLNDSKRCFAIKQSRIKAILKLNPPKRTMKHLGYRSLDSLIKTENPALIIAAAWIAESPAWRKRLLEQYKKLTSPDFEDRQITIIYPNSKRWQEFSSNVVMENKYNVMSIKELGAVVMFSLPEDAPSGSLTTSLCLALHELNEIRACSTFLKLSQVKSDYGELVAKIALAEPELTSKLLDQPVPWNLVQRYYAKLSDNFRKEVFEPYVRLEDMVWQPIEQTIIQIEPRLKFWTDTACLGIVDEAKAVSINLLDNALNLCNKRNFEDRLNSYFQRSLLHELLIRYLRHEPVEQTILSELQPAYVYDESNI